MTRSHENNNISRRSFMAWSGSAIGLATLASMKQPDMMMTKNDPQIDPEKILRIETQADVLVIGGGMAGLFAAVKAHDAGAGVLLVCKGRLGASGQTPFAKGIFAYDPEKENLSLDEFTDAVSRSALGTNNPVYTRQVAEHSLARVNELKEWGFFDATLCYNAFNKPIKQRKIPVKERIVVTHLIKEDGKIAGAAGFSLDDEKVYFFKAKSVILCTGAGGFKPNGFPICDLTHDGTIMAYNIGAKVTGKEWNDGHPGNAEHPAACFDGWHGMFERTPGTTGIGIRHDLGVDLNYKAYVAGNPISMRGPGSGSDIQGGPYRPAGVGQEGPGQGRRGRGPGSGPGGLSCTVKVRDVQKVPAQGTAAPPETAARAAKKAAHLPAWAEHPLAALQQACPSINRKGWSRSTIKANQRFRVCMPPATPWALTWPVPFTPRSAPH